MQHGITYKHPFIRHAGGGEGGLLSSDHAEEGKAKRSTGSERRWGGMLQTFLKVYQVEVAADDARWGLHGQDCRTWWLQQSERDKGGDGGSELQRKTRYMTS